MRIFLGIDGGGSGCRAQAQLESGARTAVLTGGAANVYTDPDGAVARIAALAAQTVAAARALAPGCGAPQVHAVLGVAGASESGAAPRLRAALGFARVHVMGDVDAALDGALRDGDGVVAAIGTGSVFARRLGGATLRIGGHGFTLGDEGGGAWIGRAALVHALHALDGLADPSPLSAAVWAAHRDAPALLAFARDATPADVATWARVALRCAEQGCPAASGILDAAAGWLARAVARLQPPGAALGVACVGGLGPILADRLAARGGWVWPRLQPLGAALDGALWRATRLDADDAALDAGPRP